MYHYFWLLHRFKGDNSHVSWSDKNFIMGFFMDNVKPRLFKLCIIITLLLFWKLTAELSSSLHCSKTNTIHGKDVLPQDITHLIQRPCYQWGSPCQDPVGNWTTQRPPDDREGTQTAVVWSCFPFTRSGQNHLARHSERGKKTRQTEEEVGRQHQGMDRPWVCQVPEGSREMRNIEETGCEIICGAPTTLTVNG